MLNGSIVCHMKWNIFWDVGNVGLHVAALLKIKQAHLNFEPFDIFDNRQFCLLCLCHEKQMCCSTVGTEGK